MARRRFGSLTCSGAGWVESTLPSVASEAGRAGSLRGATAKSVMAATSARPASTAKATRQSVCCAAQAPAGTAKA